MGLILGANLVKWALHSKQTGLLVMLLFVFQGREEIESEGFQVTSLVTKLSPKTKNSTSHSMSH